VSLAMLFAVVTAFALFFGLIQPPRPMVPATERERRILKLASDFVASRGVTDFAVPISIKPSYKKDGTVVVTYWTPRREIRMLGNRQVIVDPESESVQIVMRD
jgi:hypothetical protein